MAAPPLVFDLIGIVFMAILYGLYCQLFGSYWRMQLKRADRWRALITVIFILSTAYFIIGIILVQFSITRSVLQENSLDSAVTRTNISYTAIHIAIDFISLSILLYRCWIMWRQPLAMLIPCILSLAYLVTALAYLGFGIKNLVSTANPSRIFSVATAFLFLSMGTNASVTALIVYKILTIYKDLRGSDTSDGRDINPFVPILIESGLITFIGRLIRSIMYYESAYYAYPLVRCVTMLYGILSTVILVRVETGVSYDKHTSRTEDSVDSERPIQLWKVNH